MRGLKKRIEEEEEIGYATDVPSIVDSCNSLLRQKFHIAGSRLALTFVEGKANRYRRVYCGRSMTLFI